MTPHELEQIKKELQEVWNDVGSYSTIHDDRAVWCGKTIEVLLAEVERSQVENAKLREALGRIAFRPIGGKTEDYLCSARLQEEARAALSQDQEKRDE